MIGAARAPTLGGLGSPATFLVSNNSPLPRINRTLSYPNNKNKKHFLFKPPLTSSSLMDTLGGAFVSAAGVSTLPFDNGGNTNVFALSPCLLKINKGDITKWSVDGSSDAIVSCKPFIFISWVLFFLDSF
jgi:hypothetical protein